MTSKKQFIIVRPNPFPTHHDQCQRYSVEDGWDSGEASASSVFDTVADAMAAAPKESGVRIENWRTCDVQRRWIDGGWR